MIFIFGKCLTKPLHNHYYCLLDCCNVCIDKHLIILCRFDNCTDTFVILDSTIKYVADGGYLGLVFKTFLWSFDISSRKMWNQDVWEFVEKGIKFKYINI